MIASSQLNALVLDYLVVEGYRDAAEEFLRETSDRGSYLPGKGDAGYLSSDDDDDAMAGPGAVGSGSLDNADKLDLTAIEVSRLVLLLDCPAYPLVGPVLNELFVYHYTVRLANSVTPRLVRPTVIRTTARTLARPCILAFARLLVALAPPAGEDAYPPGARERAG